MAMSNAINFNLSSVDDLFSTEESRADEKLQKVREVALSEIDDFPDLHRTSKNRHSKKEPPMV